MSNIKISQLTDVGYKASLIIPAVDTSLAAGSQNVGILASTLIAAAGSVSGTVSGGIAPPSAGNIITTMASTDDVSVYSGGGLKWITISNLLSSQGETISQGSAAGSITPSNQFWINQGGTTDVVASMSELLTYIQSSLPPAQPATVPVSADYTLQSTDNGRGLVCTSPVIISAPTNFSTLGDGWKTQIVNLSGGDVTLGTGITIPSGGSLIPSNVSVDLLATTATTLSGAIVALINGSIVMAPSVPVNLTTGSTGTSSVTVLWSADTGATPTAYNLRYEPSSGTVWTTIGSLTAQNYIITGLSTASSYNVEVQAIGPGGSSNWSAPLMISTSDTLLPPGATTGLASSSQTSISVALQWNAPTTGGTPDDYVVGYRLNSVGGTFSIASSTVPSSSASYTVTGLTASTAYDFEVYATNTSGSGAAAILIDVSTSVAAPGQVTGLAAGTPTATTMPLSWTAPATGGTPSGYVVEFAISGSGAWTIASNNVIGTTYTVTSLAASSSYDFRVTASNTGGTGTPSSTLTASTVAYVAPGSVTGLVGTAGQYDMALSWTPPSTGDGPFSYTVQYALHGNTLTTIQSGVTTTNFDVTGLSPSTSYDFAVYGSGPGGNGSAATLTASTNAQVFTLDTLATPSVAAYSFRRLRSAHAGSAIQIGDITGTTTQDIGFTSHGEFDAASAISWANTNTGGTAAIIKFYDQSGNGRDLTGGSIGGGIKYALIVNGGSLSTTGVNSRAALNDATYEDYYAATSAPSSIAAMGIVAGMTTANNGAMVLEYSGSGGFYTAYGLRTRSTTAGDVDAYYGATVVPVINGTPTNTMPTTGLSSIYSSGTAATGAIAVKLGTSSTGNNWGGPICEAIVFATSLSSTDQTNLYQDQKTYYGTP